jgi:hypothetical protein
MLPDSGGKQANLFGNYVSLSFFSNGKLFAETFAESHRAEKYSLSNQLASLIAG